jgi:7-cyano-7-deazaguanine reductase
MDHPDLETFETPQHVEHVVYTSDEVAAVCPKTGQPDWYTVTIDMLPDRRCIESKSLKLYLQSFRNDGIFCESFAELIAEAVWAQVKPFRLSVAVQQKPRGGITIVATAERDSSA